MDLAADPFPDPLGRVSLKPCLNYCAETKHKLKQLSARMTQISTAVGSWRDVPKSVSNRCRNLAHYVRHPRGCMTKVFHELRLVICFQIPAQLRDDAIIHLAATDPAQRLDHMAADCASGGHGAGRGVFQGDLTFADLNAAASPVGKINCLGWHLVGNAKVIGTTSAGRLQDNAIPAGDGFDDGLGGRRQRTDQWMTVRHVVKST